MRYWRTKRKVTEMVGYLPSPFLRCFKHQDEIAKSIKTQNGAQIRVVCFGLACFISLLCLMSKLQAFFTIT